MVQSSNGMEDSGRDLTSEASDVTDGVADESNKGTFPECVLSQLIQDIVTSICPSHPRCISRKGENAAKNHKRQTHKDKQA